MNGFQIKAFVNKIKLDKMNIISAKGGYFVVTDDSPIKEGYCLDTDTDEVIYYNGNYGEETPVRFKKITHSFPHLAGTIEITDILKSLKTELDELRVYEPVNGMGKWGKKVIMDKLIRQINELENL